MGGSGRLATEGVRENCWPTLAVPINKLTIIILQNHAVIQLIYGKMFLNFEHFFLFSNKMLIFRAGCHNIFLRIANRGNLDQIASSEAV